jgi:superfamily II RNA helicase
MNWPLESRRPPQSECTPDILLDRFLDYVVSKKLELYPAQEEAILAIFSGKNVILNTPTGSGKSLVALALHFYALSMGRRSFYTCPIKALVNEKFRDLCADFGPDQVGMITGDGSVNPQAPIICCTAEILANLALREGELARVDDVVMDEFHYYSDKQRGTAWQVPLITLPQTRFLLMSATLGEMQSFSDVLSKLNEKPTDIVSSTDRPVPLDFEYRETPLHETVAELVSKSLAPIYLVNFSQREAAEEAQNLLSVDFATKEEKAAIKTELEGIKFQSPYGKDMQRLLRHGIGLHHAGLLPKYRVMVERLAQKGMLKVISGTDTLGVGVNVPIRTVLFTKLCKYDGEKTGILGVRDFHQISGRAGRRGFDTRGTVVAQAPAHVIENLRLKLKAAGDPKKTRKIVMRNPPPKGFQMWDKETFNRLINSQPEPLVSRFQMSHGMLLNVVGRENGIRAMQRLVRQSHGTATHKKSLRRSAFELFRSLLDRKIVEVTAGRQIRVNMDLQDDFSLNQSLSLYMLDAIQLLDRQVLGEELYALDVLTLVEAILESPDLILRKQLDRVKAEKMRELKASGMEFDERIEELEKLEYPKPNRDFIYSTFNNFSDQHPWVGQENIRPKSIAREMYEGFYSFGEYIREYELQRVEGLLLRYLSDVYKVLEQTVPENAKNDELRSIAIYFGTMIAQVDSSLLEDWERLRRSEEISPVAAVTTRTISETGETQHAPNFDLVLDRRRLTLLVRNEVHRFVKALSRQDFEEAVLIIQPRKTEIEGGEWTAAELEKRIAVYLMDHQKLMSDSASRQTDKTQLHFDSAPWKIEQTLVDPEAHNDWSADFEVDMAGLQKGLLPILILNSIGPVGI